MGWTAPDGIDVPSCGRQRAATRGPPAMSITMIGLDTAKSVFQLHGVDATGQVQLKRRLRRDELIAFFEQQPRCTVVMEACGAAHHWARVLSGLGYEVKLIASEAVKPFVKRGKKNDPADAAAICAAASRPEAKVVAVKSLEQQGVLARHRADHRLAARSDGRRHHRELQERTPFRRLAGLGAAPALDGR